MKLTKLWIIVGVMSFTILGSIMIQVYWIAGAVKENEKRFKIMIHEALNRVADRLIEEEKNELEKIKSLSELKLNNIRLAKKNGRFFPDSTKYRLSLGTDVAQQMSLLRYMNKSSLEDRINPMVLDNIISDEFTNRGLHLNYTYAVYDIAERSIIIKDGHYTALVKDDENNFSKGMVVDDAELNRFKYTVNLFTSSYGSPGLLMLSFPNEASAFWKNIWKTVLASVFLTLLTLFCFAYAVYVILSQKKLSAIKTDFINNMTHEFKTPIATISLASDSIKNPKIIKQPEKVSKFVDIIKEENKRMLKQVEKVLQVALLDKRDFQLKLAEVDIHELIQKAVVHFELIVANRNGQIVTELNATNSLIVADENHISNVIYNLLDNANKYSPQNPSIKLCTYNQKDGIQIEVIDNGIGISSEAKKRIFEKFYRVHTGDRHDVKGFGLGLSYVKSIIEKHHGTVSVKSKPGKGSRFFVFLPFKQPK